MGANEKADVTELAPSRNSFSNSKPHTADDHSLDIDGNLSPDGLSMLVADKDLETFRKLGGTTALLQQLNVDSETGIVPLSESQDPDGLVKMPTRAGEIANELAKEQNDETLTWLGEFETDMKLYFERVAKFGVNILPPAKSRSFLGLVWDALHDKMLILLVVAAVVSLGIGIYQDVRPNPDPEDSEDVHWVEGFAIIVAISVVTLVASINDFQKEKQFRRLNAKKNDRRVRVTRSGQERLISTNCIMVGDILHIEPGDILCADGIVISSSNLKCDESSVTGESDALKKRCLEEADQANADRRRDRQNRRADLRTKRREQRAAALRAKGETVEIETEGQSGVDADESTDGENDLTHKATVDQLVEEKPSKPKTSGGSKNADPFLISGSRVLEGVGRCVIVAVGEKSFYGRTLMSLRKENEPTPLQAKLNDLAELIAKLGGAAGLLMFIVLIIKYFVQFGRHEVSREATKVVDNVVRIIITAVTIVVVAVPEGLPLAVTLSLAVATTRMLKDNCLVRVLASCETMGNATTICSDKTGTLTQNRMTVVSGCIGDQYQFSSYPPGTSAMQRRRARQPPSDGLVTDMTGRAVAPEKAVVPTLLETETRRQRRLRDRRQRHQRRRLGRMGSSGFSSSSAMTPLSDASPSVSGISDLSDFSDDEDLIIPTAELAEEAPHAIMSLCHDAIAVCSTAFIPADDPSSTSDSNLDVTDTKAKAPLWRRIFGRTGKKGAQAGNEESSGEANAHISSADKFTGSKTETAMLSWSEILGAPNYSQLRDTDIERRVQVWPFSSERKSMSTMVKIRRREDNKSVWRLYVKGAPEMVLENCRWVVDVDGAFQRQDREEIMNQQGSSNPSMISYSGDDEDDVRISAPAMPNIPQINLENDSDDDLEVSGRGPAGEPLPLLRIDATDNDDASSSPNIPALATGTSSYLLSAHYTGSQNIGSDTTDVNDDTSLAQSFPSDFAHNPAIPALPLDDETLRDLRRTVAHYASRALRTIGVAYRDFETFDEARLAQLENDSELRETAGLVCLGIFAIEDPLREGVTDAVRRCQNAGIIVRMVTGDNVLTARAIATQCGIYTPGMGGIVLEGPKFRRLSPEQMDVIIPRLQVLARSSPEDKRMLVEWLRTHGEVVSVTGDGTNDGPALKAANVGFSMGIAGTEVAKEASSIVVMDDNFKSIVRACMWGRAVNDSVKKFLQFQLTVNVTAVLIAFVSSIVDKEQKSVFTAVQLLWINLIMDTFAALALATDPPSETLLDRYPEKQGSPLITFTMWKNIIGQSIFQVVVCFLTLYAADDIFHLHTVESSYDMLVLRTLVFNTFAWMQIFNEFNCRVLHNEVNCFKGMQKNMFFLGIVLISVVGQVIIIQWGGAAFQTTALSAKYWAFSIIGGFVSLPVGLVLRLVPDKLIWWMMPFISQDIYKAPPNLEWQPPAQNVQSKLIGDTEGHVRRNRDSDNDDEYGAADQYNPLAASDAKDGVQKSSVFKLGSELSKRFQKPRGAAPRASALAANSRPKHAAAQPPPPDNSAANEQTNNGDNAEDASTNSNVRPAREHKKHGGHRHGRRGSDQPTKNVLAAAMVPSMVASSVGIGMSTSAMPPNQMSFADMVDKELEKPPRPPTP